MDSAPEWVGRQYPDSLFVTSNGQAIRPESSPGYCLDHPARAQGRPRLLRGGRPPGRARARPSSASTCGASPTSSTGRTRPTSTNPEFCFCRNTVARFREWLKRKYGTLDALNAAWYRRLRVLGRGRAEPPQHDPLLHRLHRLEDVHRRQARRGPARALRGGEARRPGPRRHEPRRRRRALLLAALLGGPVRRLDDGAPRSTTTARPSTRSTRPSWTATSSGAGRSSTSRARSGSRTGGRGFWIGELQARLRDDRPQRLPDRHARRTCAIWTWSALARGAKAICTYAYYPMSTGYESGGFGLIQLDGTITERARVAGEIARRWGSAPRSSSRARPAAVGGRGRLQPARALRRRAAAGDRLRRAAGRGGGHRARLAPRDLPGAVPDQRAPRLRPRRPPEGGRARGPTSSS